MSCERTLQSAAMSNIKIKIFVYRVAMSCDGCAAAIHRVLGKYKDKGIQNVEIDMDAQTVKVTVNTDFSADEVLELIKRTGKSAEYMKP